MRRQKQRVKPPDQLAPTVYVVTGWLNNQAVCDCGWTGKRRWSRASAQLDAVKHFGQTRHQIS